MFDCLKQTQAQKLYRREIFSVKSDVKSEWNKNSCNFFAFIVIGQCRWDRKQSGRKRGMGSGKILEPGFELGTRSARAHHVDELPTRLSVLTSLQFYSKCQTSIFWWNDRLLSVDIYRTHHLIINCKLALKPVSIQSTTGELKSPTCILFPDKSATHTASLSSFFYFMTRGKKRQGAILPPTVLESKPDSVSLHGKEELGHFA